MIELRDTVTIDAGPEVVWSWLESMPEHILDWHPDHRAARWVRHTGFEPGAVMEVEELLHGKLHKLRMTLIDVVPGRLVQYRIFPGCSGELHVRAVNGGTEFTAIIRMGIRIPVVGRFVDGLLRQVLGDRIEAIRRHQAEEGANLKALLEHSPT